MWTLAHIFALITVGVMLVVQGVCELREVHQDPFASGSAADELGRRSGEQRCPQPGVQQLGGRGQCLEGSL